MGDDTANNRSRCGRFATLERLSSVSGAVTTVCTLCARAGDRQLRAPLTIPVVTVSCEITLAGASRISDVARYEAVEKLRLAVAAAGGWLTVTGVTSALARYYPHGAAAGRPGETGQG